MLESDITALIGANGAGKSAFIEALRRMFGVTREERTMKQADVHFAPNERPDQVSERKVVIDVVFAFPELRDDAQDAVNTVPAVFRYMTASEIGNPLRVRMRLEALWRNNEGYVDEIESANYWVKHLGDVEFGEDGENGLHKERVRGTDREKIRLIYVPATRDGSAVIRQVMRSLLVRLERSAVINEETERCIQKISDRLQKEVERLPAVKRIATKLDEYWRFLHREKRLGKASLEVQSGEFSQILRNLKANFSPTPSGREYGIDGLSEGQSSLFFLAAAATLAQLESEIATNEPPEGFREQDVIPPAITIYAVEEPENHLAPFYISRLMSLLGDLCGGIHAIGIVTSHAPAVLRRLSPNKVRHFRLDASDLLAKVNPISLPENNADAGKFIRQAVTAHPELYFAKLVILGEGDSEAVVIPRIAAAIGLDLDPSFVAYVPLGGRHVNHLWSLLGNLGIPFLTLLDFDLGRHGAGPLRLKYAHGQLEIIGKKVSINKSSDGLDKTSYWEELNRQDLKKWIVELRRHGVYFSYPLDLDMLMLKEFSGAYENEIKEDSRADWRVDELEVSVFGSGGSIKKYEDYGFKKDKPTKSDLHNYDYLFKRRSKPTSHLAALAVLSDEEIKKSCPEVLKKLIEDAEAQINHETMADVG